MKGFLAKALVQFVMLTVFSAIGLFIRIINDPEASFHPIGAAIGNPGIDNRVGTSVDIVESQVGILVEVD